MSAKHLVAMLYAGRPEDEIVNYFNQLSPPELFSDLDANVRRVDDKDSPSQIPITALLMTLKRLGYPTLFTQVLTLMSQSNVNFEDFKTYFYQASKLFSDEECLSLLESFCQTQEPTMEDWVSFAVNAARNGHLRTINWISSHQPEALLDQKVLRQSVNVDVYSLINQLASHHPNYKPSPLFTFSSKAVALHHMNETHDTSPFRSSKYKLKALELEFIHLNKEKFLWFQSYLNEDEKTELTERLPLFFNRVVQKSKEKNMPSFHKSFMSFLEEVLPVLAPCVFESINGEQPTILTALGEEAEPFLNALSTAPCPNLKSLFFDTHLTLFIDSISPEALPSILITNPDYVLPILNAACESRPELIESCLSTLTTTFNNPTLLEEIVTAFPDESKELFSPEREKSQPVAAFFLAHSSTTLTDLRVINFPEAFDTLKNHEIIKPSTHEEERIAKIRALLNQSSHQEHVETESETESFFSSSPASMISEGDRTKLYGKNARQQEFLHWQKQTTNSATVWLVENHHSGTLNLTDFYQVFGKHRQAMAVKAGTENAHYFGENRLLTQNDMVTPFYSTLHYPPYSRSLMEELLTDEETLEKSTLVYDVKGVGLNSHFDREDGFLTGVEYSLEFHDMSWLHCPSEDIRQLLQKAGSLVMELLDENEIEDEDLIEKLAELHWCLAHAAPMQRGSASLSEILVKAVGLNHNVKLSWTEMPDLIALSTRNFEHYKERYKETTYLTPTTEHSALKPPSIGL